MNGCVAAAPVRVATATPGAAPYNAASHRGLGTMKRRGLLAFGAAYLVTVPAVVLP
jgi:hypothetical protein